MALSNEDTLLRTHCCSWCFLGAQTRGTQNECCVSMLRKLGNINFCCGGKMFLNKIRNIFFFPDTKFVSATNVARAGKRGNICVGNNMSSFARASSEFWLTTSDTFSSNRETHLSRETWQRELNKNNNNNNNNNRGQNKICIWGRTTGFSAR